MWDPDGESCPSTAVGPGPSEEWTLKGEGRQEERDEEEEEVPQGKVAAVVPAAGCGERMGNSTPKQYLTVCGRPLVTHCLVALEEVAWVARVVVVADDQERMEGVVARAGLTKVTVIQGGGSRHRSILAGVEALAEGGDPPDVVVVHDGVRPLLPRSALARVAVCAERHGAAGVVRPLVSTVVRPDSEDFLQESLVRSRYRNSEMPQAFRFTVLREAYRRCSEEEMDHGTECLALVLQAGVQAKLVPGPPLLWKVTEEKDLVVARSVLPRHARSVIVLCRALSLASPAVTTELGLENVARTIIDDLSCKEGEHNPAALNCGRECLLVLQGLESSLRKHSKELHISSSCKISIPPSSSTVVVVITRLDSTSALEEHVNNIAREVARDVCTIIMVFTTRPQKCELTIPGITRLQQQVRDAFREHSGHATVLLVPLDDETRTHKEKLICGVLEESIAGRLGNLVTTLMEQQSGCFQGQVLVL